MNSNTETNNFSSYYDTSADAYSFNDQEQLVKNTDIIKVVRDETSGLEKVVLSNGCFQYNSETFLNDTIKDYLIYSSAPIRNQQLPVTVSSSGYFDITHNTKSDYFLWPPSFEVTINAQLFVVKANGTRRPITDADCLVPVDGLQPVKNVRPHFEGQGTIQQGKQIDQRSFSRVMKILTETMDPLAAKRRENYSRSFFEPETTDNNKNYKTKSHSWKVVSPATKKTLNIYELNEQGSSYQNTYLSHVIKDAFQFRLDLSQVPPFNSAVLFSRPCENIALNLEFCKFSDWLRICIPDGKPDGPRTLNSDALQSNFSNLEFDIKEVSVSYAQFALNTALLDYYIQKTTSNTFSNIPQQVTEIYQIASPVPQNSYEWSTVLTNIIVPERLFIIFQTEDNKNKIKGNPFHYSNVGVSEISFNVLSTSENRFNQHLTSCFGTDKTICSTSESYDVLTLNETYRANAYAADMILNPAHLAAGHSTVGANLKHTFLINEESIYKGQCVYCINTGIQMESNRSLKEITRRGNTEISIVFKKATLKDYYCTIFCSYSGELISKYLFIFIVRICTPLLYPPLFHHFQEGNESHSCK